MSSHRHSRRVFVWLDRHVWLLTPALGLFGCLQRHEGMAREDDDPALDDTPAIVEAGAPVLLPGALDAAVAAQPSPPLVPGDLIDTCSGLSPEACSTMPACGLFHALGLDPVLGCATGDRRPLCTPPLSGLLGGGLSGSAIARDATGRTFYVPWADLPADLTPVAPQSSTPARYPEPCPTPPADEACARHTDLLSCARDMYWSCRPQVAERYNPMSHCVGGSDDFDQFLGCRAERKLPGPNGTFRDAKGDVWSVAPFALDVVPPGWTRINAPSVFPGAGDVLPPCFGEL
jgi:hypothetical protein